MKIITDEAVIQEVLNRGVDEVIDRTDLEKKLRSGQKLRIKLGIDPTSPNIHIGRSIPLLKLRDFQDLGHQVVFIVGDFTAVIGDTSDKDSERPMLTNEQVAQNLKNYKAQASKIIDMKKAEFHFNSKWLKKLGFHEIGEQADLFSINQFISRDNIARRLEDGKRVSLRETLYPLMQGYDSVAVKADVELGGTDQRFNLLAGRTLQPKYGQAPQNIVTNPLVNGLDGRKMSSSWGNTVNVADEPNDMFGKVMSMRDEDIITYFTTMTRISMQDIETMRGELESGMNPKEIKLRLAHEITRMYHGEKLAENAEMYWEDTFSKGSVPSDMEQATVAHGASLVETLLEKGLVSSKTEFRRLANEGAIKILELANEIKENATIEADMSLSEGMKLKIGKKRFIEIRIK